MLQRFILFATASLVLTSCTDASAPKTPGVAVSLRAVSATALTGAAGSIVTDRPSVIVTDAAGTPVSGVEVHFLVDGGIVTGADTFTNGLGVATVASWSLPTKVGTSLVAASSPGLPSVTFLASAVAGPPDHMRKIGGDNQVGVAASLVRFTPQVAVGDAFDNPISGLAVTFKVEAGGGSINESSAVTDSAGVASARAWVLGTPGLQVLSARTSTLGPVTFSATAATATEQICTALGELQAGVPLNSSLGNATCPGADGRFSESFIVRGSGGTGTRLHMESSKFNTVLEVRTLSGDLVATNDDVGDHDTNSLVTVLLPAQNFIVTATSAHPSDAGAYKLWYEIVGAGSNCGSAFITPGIDVDWTMSSSDSCGSRLPIATERYRVFMKAGTPVRFEVVDRSYNGPSVVLLDGGNSMAAGERVEQYYHHIVSFTPSYDGYFTLQVTGSYEELIEYELHVR